MNHFITQRSDSKYEVNLLISRTFLRIPSFQVAREHVLPLFNDVFSAMSVAITDVDQVCSIIFGHLNIFFCNYMYCMWKVESEKLSTPNLDSTRTSVWPPSSWSS